MRASIRARQLGRMQDESEKRMFEDVVWSTYTERVHQFQSGALRLYSQASKQNVSQTVTRPFLLTFQEDGCADWGISRQLLWRFSPSTRSPDCLISEILVCRPTPFSS